MDELAYDLGIDPIELRLRNEPDRDPGTGAPFSTRRLRECFRVGSRTVGWDGRDPEPRSARDGDWLLGTGVAVASYHTQRAPAQALARLDADGTAIVQCATSDMGPGTYTSMTQVAADALGLPVPGVRFQLGDSTMPLSPPHGGSMTMASVGSAVQDTCDKLRRQAVRLAVEDPGSPLHGASADDVVVRNGRLHLRDDPGRGETYRQLLARADRPHLEARGGYAPGDEQERFSTHAYGAVFAQVAVDERLGLVRIRRVLGVVKGLGEVVIVGVAPAIANAVFHATGRRVRELPITADALL
ncbi:molybdopterin cofactor-binding domain-containing protein [Nonomuraea angiospora]|uniref:xanthine dehydrogenase family protein molybdopterin-binding subunit n=1 Tax=Nonomuraea angiospora TaxID=46172 RepID=UPI0033FB63D8